MSSAHVEKVSLELVWEDGIARGQGERGGEAHLKMSQQRNIHKLGAFRSEFISNRTCTPEKEYTHRGRVTRKEKESLENAAHIHAIPL